MKIRLLVLFLLPLLCISWTDDSNPVYASNLLNARKKANERQVPYVIIFEAEWCSPCKWMDKFTLSNPQVKDYLQKHYSAVRMDIDAFEGFALKEQYGVKILPSILFFDQNNEVIGRYENTFEPDAFMNILRFHKDFRKQEVKSTTSRRITSSTPTTSTPSSSTTHTANKTTSSQAPVVRNSSTCTIQVGAFNSYENALALKKRVEHLQGIHDEVHIRELTNDRFRYRVTVGVYANRPAASPMLFGLDDHGIKGLVKRIDQF